jgi:hypothetical protein
MGKIDKNLKHLAQGTELVQNPSRPTNKINIKLDADISYDFCCSFVMLDMGHFKAIFNIKYLGHKN